MAGLFCLKPIENPSTFGQGRENEMPRSRISPDSFEPLRGHSFAVGASCEALTLLDTLDRFKVCFDEQGQRTPEGHRLFQEHFTGNNARWAIQKLTVFLNSR